MPTSLLPRLVSVTLLAYAMLSAPAIADSSRGAARPSGEDSIGIRLLEIPANRMDDPRAHAFIVDHVNPGTTFTRRFEVYNISDKPQHVQLYTAGAGISHGRFTFEPERTSNELSSWIKLNQAATDLPPHGRTSVKATVGIPAWAPKGERYAVIWAQISSPGAGREKGITLVNRVGLRAYLDVGPGGEPPSDFKIAKILPQRTEDGQPKIVATIANTGERAIDLEGQLSLTDGPSSLSAGPFPIDRGTTLAPGQQGDVSVHLGEDLPDGPWKFSLTLRSGRIDKTETGTLTFPRKAGSWGLAAVSDAPLALILVLPGLAALAAGTILIIAFRRSRARRKSATGADSSR
ncbi:hypothetical protein [Nonomuraea sp. NPDC049158]|uniref:hypothetical protein n=1 Tax=Nonomuraea sp. NPDC049158 TaxID=3155649 RepID=UPI003403747B